MRELPMFPLGHAVLPGTILPLHLFEPRYIQLLLDVGAGDGTFGTALITRGREAGTDADQARADRGTLIRILQHERIDTDDGSLRYALVGAAESRLEVVEWLEDDPYPRAMVRDLDEPSGGPGHGPAVGEALAMVANVLNMREELGEGPLGGLDAISERPAMASFQIAALAGVGPHDAIQILAEDDLDRRLALVNRALRDIMEALSFRLGN